MESGNLKLFQMAHKQMNWLSQRQTVLAENIANGDTPGYGAKDMKPLSFKRTLKLPQAINVGRTTKGHLTGTIMRPDFDVRKDRGKDVYETAPDGNSVNLEDQIMKVSKTNMRFQLITNLYDKHMKMMKTAIGKGEN
ncbi:MAG: flagellar basal body rod protein FlgB [Rhodospirillaceae bacterium]|jgi:flagellar basal-body rod protein FlgB|nr:flagellar basal body rod protein FlgB [Rhodospirillaceae bacterium]